MSATALSRSLLSGGCAVARLARSAIRTASAMRLRGFMGADSAMPQAAKTVDTSEDLTDHLAARQRQWTTQPIVDFRIGTHAEAVEHRGEQILRQHAAIFRVAGDLVGCAVDDTAIYPAA